MAAIALYASSGLQLRLSMLGQWSKLDCKSPASLRKERAVLGAATVRCCMPFGRVDIALTVAVSIFNYSIRYRCSAVQASNLMSLCLTSAETIVNTTVPAIALSWAQIASGNQTLHCTNDRPVISSHTNFLCLCAVAHRVVSTLSGCSMLRQP